MQQSLRKHSSHVSQASLSALQYLPVCLCQTFSWAACMVASWGCSSPKESAMRLIQVRSPVTIYRSLRTDTVTIHLAQPPIKQPNNGINEYLIACSTGNRLIGCGVYRQLRINWSCSTARRILPDDHFSNCDCD